MHTRIRQRELQFEVTDGRLIRTVISPTSRQYTHRGNRKVYEAVAYAIEEAGEPIGRACGRRRR